MRSIAATVVSLCVISVMLVSCATQEKLSEQDALNKYPSVAEFEQSFKQVDEKKLALLSQQSFKKASEALSKAKVMAMDNDADASSVALDGQRHLKAAIINAADASDVFFEVLEARGKAIERGAATASAQGLQDIDNDFRELALALENGDEAGAKIRRPELIQRYSNLELSSLKKATVENAKSALQRAKANQADRYAAKTYNSAAHQLGLASSLLEADLTSLERAEKHAAKAVWLAQRSMSISDTVKEFRSNDFSLEDIVLWHQSQLGKAVTPIESDPPFNLANHNLVNAISGSINALINEHNTLKKELIQSQNQYSKAVNARKTELAAMEKQIQSSDQKRQEQERIEQTSRDKLAAVQSLFSEDEASVYLQHGNVLIRAHGFWFPTGKSEIDSKNFVLLNKINQAIGQFPDSKIVVSGHTDSVGNDEINMVLSEARADKVARFIHEVGNISVGRVSAQGFGKTKPVATNETVDGRAENRRVEVLIINQ